jgi:hypothetical protein
MSPMLSRGALRLRSSSSVHRARRSVGDRESMTRVDDRDDRYCFVLDLELTLWTSVAAPA